MRHVSRRAACTGALPAEMPPLARQVSDLLLRRLPPICAKVKLCRIHLTNVPCFRIHTTA